jgi:molecular chaperone Hsp33
LSRICQAPNERQFLSLPLRAQCSCSRDAVSSMLKSFAPKDRAEMVKDDKVVNCEFCSSVRHSSLEYSGLCGEGSIPVPLPPPSKKNKPLILLN